MDEMDATVIRTALRTLAAAGGAGVLRADLLAQIDRAHGSPLSEDERDAFFALLRDRGWTESHLEPILRQRRWTLTPRGLDALEGLG